MICVPGFIGDAVGLLLMIGPVRHLLIRAAGRRLARRVQTMGTGGWRVINVGSRSMRDGSSPPPAAPRRPLGPGERAGDDDRMTWASLQEGLPLPRPLPGARPAIRGSRLETGQRTLVLDDDPTGSQAVHGVEAVLVLDEDAVARALELPGSTCFVLTNSRSLPEGEARLVALRLGRLALSLEDRLGGTVQVVSRSDSTLRGHLLTEVRALDEALCQATGRGYEGVLLVPCYLEAGRFTADDVHWARIGGEVLPVGETEFARDSSFGYSSSNLRFFLEEKSRGTISADDVASISLEDIRLGGADRVTEILLGKLDGRFVIVNATDYADLDVVTLGLLAAQQQGHRFLVRSGPSFVQALTGLDPVPPVRSRTIWPDGRPPGHGLVVVGSHVDLTNRQIEVLVQTGGIAAVVVDVDALAEGAGTVLRRCTAEARRALDDEDVLLVTTRSVRTGGDPEESLRVSRSISAGLVAIVNGILPSRPAWVIAKGGITAHDVLARGLGIRRAEVVGQLFPGLVSVFRPLEASPEAIGIPCIIFAGNVGDEAALAQAVEILRAPPDACGSSG